MKTITLYNGIKMPVIGLGTYGLKAGEETYQTVLMALKLGYRHIDTAIVYHNEKDVGRAIHDFGIPRDELFITSKLPPHIKTFEGALRFFNRSLENLGLSYLDAYIINAPRPFDDDNQSFDSGNILAYKALEKLYDEELVTAIGLSNFTNDEVIYMMEHTKIKPHVLQNKYHIGFINQKNISFANAYHLSIQAYSPLANGKVFKHRLIDDLAIQYHCKPSQIAISYILLKGLAPIIKSQRLSHLEENINSMVILSDEDMIKLDALSDQSNF